MTICLSIIENILNISKYKIYIVCDKKQNDFARIYLSEFKGRILYKDIVTDIGFMNKENSLEIDIVLLQKYLDEFVSSWEYVVNDECEFLKTLNVKCIVSDISPIGCIVGNKLNLSTIFISNFSWVEQYKYLGLDDKIVNKFKEAYSYTNKFIKYDLCLATDSIHVNETYEVGFICRNIDKSRVYDIQEKYGKSIFITCGKSANLQRIKVKNFIGTIFITSGVEIVCDSECDIVELPINILDTQNYIVASDVVISKAGWSTIAEGILGHSNLVLIEIPSSREDSFNIEKIKERKLCISITEIDLTNIDIEEIKEQLKINIDYRKLNSYKNDVKKVIDFILNH